MRTQDLDGLGHMIPGVEIIIGYLSLECQLCLATSIEALADMVVVPAEPGMPSPKRECIALLRGRGGVTQAFPQLPLGAGSRNGLPIDGVCGRASRHRFQGFGALTLRLPLIALTALAHAVVKRDAGEIRVPGCARLVEAVWRPILSSITCLLCRTTNDMLINTLMRAFQVRRALGRRTRVGRAGCWRRARSCF